MATMTPEQAAMINQRRCGVEHPYSEYEGVFCAAPLNHAGSHYNPTASVEWGSTEAPAITQLRTAAEHVEQAASFDIKAVRLQLQGIATAVSVEYRRLTDQQLPEEATMRDYDRTRARYVTLFGLLTTLHAAVDQADAVMAVALATR